jgi:DNA helicase-2/ATP-dependent DNA helicase PcrA
MSLDLKQYLNDEQYAAVAAPDGPILVLAAAGTGKTRTLVYRVVSLVERGIDPERILLLTFTNKAAREMLERAQEAVRGVSGIWGGTFHHMANRILRRHAERIGYRSDFSILDRDDSKTLVSNAIKERKLSRREFPKADVLLGIYSSCANTGSTVDDYFEDAETDYDEFAETIIDIGKEYHRRKQELMGMDFDDLLVNCVKLFRENEHVAQRYQEQFLHVLVDEYQDTNCLQAEMVDCVAAKHKNLMVVGDDFQSIYSWRGADYRNIMSFPERYPDTQVFKLETNYRSVPEILDLANKCIAGNPEQFQKVLRPTREKYQKPRLMYLRDGMDQAYHVIEMVNALTRAGYKRSDIAVLYRAHYHAMELQMALTKEQVPYVITSGIRFFEQAHVKDVCSLLKIIENPADEIAFARLIGMLPGVGPATCRKLWKGLGNSFVAADKAAREFLMSALKKGGRDVWELIDPLFDKYYEEELSADPGEMVYQFLTTSYHRYLADTYQDYGKREDDITEMVNYMSKYSDTREFLNDVALLTNLDAEAANPDEDDTESIKLSTVHQAKGLEWPVVIIIWMAETMFPSARSISESEDGEAEERRLFYVATTRAKDELVLCVPEMRRTHDGGVYACEPSRFISELPEELTKVQYSGLY